MRVLFATGSPAAYMAPPQLAEEQVVCGPDWPDTRDESGRWRSLKTPVGHYNLADVAARLPADQQPDVVVCLVDASRRNLPRGLAAFKCPRVLLIADTHHLQSPLLGLLQYMTSEPYTRNVILYDRHHAGIFRSAGVRNLFWFPGLTFPHSDKTVAQARQARRVAQIAFVGQAGKIHPRRTRLLTDMTKRGLPVTRRQLSQSAALGFYGESTVGFNASLNGDLNLRVFEIIASGAALLTDRLSPAAGLDQLLAEGVEMLAYANGDELAEIALGTMRDTEGTASIGAAGARWFDSHFSEDRRRAAFSALAFEGVQPEVLPWSDRAPASVYFSGSTQRLLRSLVVYEQVQEWHRMSDEVKVSVSNEVPADVTELLATLPRVRFTATDPTLAVVGREQPDVEATAPFLWCWDAESDDRALADRLSLRVYVRAHPQAPFFRRFAKACGDVRQHVVVYTDDPDSGGVAQYNHTIVMALASAGYRITMVQTRTENPLVTAQVEAGVVHCWIDYDTGADFGRTLTDAGPAEALFTADRPDLVIFSNCCPLSSLAAREVARRLSVPYLCVEGFVGAYLAENFSAKLPLLARQYAEARAVVAVSEENRALLVSRFGAPERCTQVIHYGRPDRFFAPRNEVTRKRLRSGLNIPSDAIVSLTTARLTPVKGFQHQLKALLQLKTRGQAKNLHLVWAGEGDLRGKLEEAVGKAGLKDRVHFIGHRWDVADWYDAADLFVLTSHLEGMPLSIMEAMAKGLPVAATAVSGIPEELGDTGCLLPNPEVDAEGLATRLASTWKTWAGDARLRTSIGEAARARACAMFHEGLMVRRTLELVALQTASSAAVPVLVA